MELKQLLTDDRAVSPVIGVILMVAITVILAAVIGTFVLGLGDQVQNVNPNTSFTFDFDESVDGKQCGGIGVSGGASGNAGEGTLSITHDGGDKIDTAQSSLSVGDDDGNSASWGACGGPDSTVTAGDTANPEVESNDVIRVTWQSEGGGSSATLGKWSGPDA